MMTLSTILGFNLYVPWVSAQSESELSIPDVDESTKAEADAIKQRTEQREAEKSKQVEQQPSGNVVRVPHVSDEVIVEIKGKVKSRLQEEVVRAVMSQAKTERWGLPEALPGWISSVRMKGDLRVRAETQINQADNLQNEYIDFLQVNAKKSNPTEEEDFLNISEDRARQRARFRLSITGKPTTNLKVGARISSGNATNPVSTNTTLGDSFNRHGIVLDQAYLQYKLVNLNGVNWADFSWGRMPNPFFSTDLLWDGDLQFEGVAATFKLNVGLSKSLYEMTDQNKKIILTLGSFPLQEVRFSQDDKWLHGAQLGYRWVSESQSAINFAVGFYHFANTTGRTNKLDDNDLDYTAPEYLQKGNALFDIRPEPTEELYALAAQYQELNGTFKWDMAFFSPYHLIWTLDYVKNMGYDEADIRRRSAGVLARSGGAVDDIFEQKTTGYMASLDFGWPLVTERGNWRLSFAYKYLERDAVMDAFTDSDFHLGGTDAQGYIFRFDYGLTNNSWLSLRYLSSKEIDAAPLGVDIVQLDISARF